MVLKKETCHLVSGKTTRSAPTSWWRCFLCAFGGIDLQCCLWPGASVWQNPLLTYIFPKQLGLAVLARVGWGECLSPSCSSGSDHCYSLLCSASLQGKGITSQHLCADFGAAPGRGWKILFLSFFLSFFFFFLFFFFFITPSHFAATFNNISYFFQDVIVWLPDDLLQDKVGLLISERYLVNWLRSNVIFKRKQMKSHGE